MRQKKERRFNYFQKKIMIIAAGILNIAIVLSAVSVATFAWFKANANVDIQVASTNMSIVADESYGSMSYEVLKYDDNQKAGVSYTGADAITNFKLPHYDTYIPEKNEVANVIVRADVQTDNLNTTTDEFTIDISRLASAFKTAGVIGSYTSNVVQFKCTVYKYKVAGNDNYVVNTASFNSIDETTAATKYATASAYFADKNTPTTFVPIRDNGEGSVIVNRKSEADTITLIPDLPTGLTVTDAIIYLECTYHNTLVNEFINSHDGEDMSYSLDGDISVIEFGRKARTSNTSDATGKYIKVESEAAASSGQYLVTYEQSSNVGKALKGSLANGTDNIDVNHNVRQVTINNATATEPKSIDSTDTIDAESFIYDRTGKTLKSQSGYYIGNNRAAADAYNIDVDTSPTNKTNTISFSDGHPVIESDSGKFLRHYSSGSSTDRIRYYAASHPVDLYRYTENVAEMPTLVSIAITQTPTALQRTFYTEHTFNINGLEVTATYSDGSTANVTKSCTFTSPNGTRTLVPEGRTSPTTFNSEQLNKTVYVNYTEGAVTIADNDRPSYVINVYAKKITSLTKSGSFSTTNWFVGDTFSPAGVTVYGEYNSGDTHADVTSSVTWSGYNMSTAGTYTITATYNNGSQDLQIEVGTIYVRNKTLEISVDSSNADGQSYTVYYGETLTIAVSHTATVAVAKSTSSYISCNSSITYNGANHAAQNHNLVVTALSTTGDTVLTFSVSNPSGFASRTVTIKVRPAPVDTLVINAGDSPIGTSGSYHSGTGSINTTGGTAINISYTDICYQGSAMQLKNNTGEIHSTSTTGEYIKSIDIDYTGGNSYTVCGSVDGSSWTELGTYSADHTFTLTSSNGYKYFKVVYNSGYVQIAKITVEYYCVSVVDVTGVHTQPESYYVGDTPSVSDFVLDVLMSDDTTSTVTPTSISLNTASAATGRTGTAYYNLASGTQSVTFTINVIIRHVTSISVSLSASSAYVGGSATATATVTPNNATTKTVTWTSSNSNVATIDSSTGAITAVAIGTCTFTASATDGSGVTGTSSTFTVNAAPVQYSVTYTANGGTGSDYVVNNIYSGSSHNLVSVATAGFTAPSGKQFKCWSVGGTERAVGYSLTVTSNVTVSAVWENIPSGYVISYSGNGKTGGTDVAANSAGNYVLASNTWTKTNCTFLGWNINGVKYAAGATVTGLTGNVTAKAIWQTSITITRSSFSTKGGYAWYDWSQSTANNTTSGTTISGKGELYTTTTASMQFNKSKGNGQAALFNTTALPGKITKIEATTASGTNRAWNAYVTSTACSLNGTSLTFGSNKTTVGSAVTITTSSTSLGTSTAGYSYFCLQENVSSASYLSQIKVTYEIW